MTHPIPGTCNSSPMVRNSSAGGTTLKPSCQIKKLIPSAPNGSTPNSTRSPEIIEQNHEPRPMPIEKVASKEIATVASPCNTLSANAGNCVNRIEPTNQNQEMPIIAKNTGPFARTILVMAMVLVKILNDSFRFGAAAGAEGIERLNHQPNMAKPTMLIIK